MLRYLTQQGNYVTDPCCAVQATNNYGDSTIKTGLPVIISNRHDLIVFSRCGALSMCMCLIIAPMGLCLKGEAWLYITVYTIILFNKWI